MDESKLSSQSQEVLSILRREMAAGRIPADQAKFLADAVRVKDGLGILGNFIVKLAGFLIAIGVVWTWWPKK